MASIIGFEMVRTFSFLVNINEPRRMSERRPEPTPPKIVSTPLFTLVNIDLVGRGPVSLSPDPKDGEGATPGAPVDTL
jgi:hypothetical protein